MSRTVTLQMLSNSQKLVVTEADSTRVVHGVKPWEYSPGVLTFDRQELITAICGHAWVDLDAEPVEVVS